MKQIKPVEPEVMMGWKCNRCGEPLIDDPAELSLHLHNKHKDDNTVIKGFDPVEL